MVESERVWESMAEAFEGSEEPLAERLLSALDAAEAAGGDWRGRQAGGIVVVPSEGQPWQREVDLRVDDHADPLGELRRLLRLRGAYNAMRGPPGPSADDVEVLPELDRPLAPRSSGPLRPAASTRAEGCSVRCSRKSRAGATSSGPSPTASCSRTPRELLDG